jgi:hypothetical protein
VRAGSSGRALVDIEVYGPDGEKVYQRWYDNQSFSGGQTKSFTTQWNLPRSAPSGTYTVKVGVFSPGWGTLYTWNNSVATFTVR